MDKKVIEGDRYSYLDTKKKQINETIAILYPPRNHVIFFFQNIWDQVETNKYIVNKK